MCLIPECEPVHSRGELANHTGQIMGAQRYERVSYKRMKHGDLPWLYYWYETTFVVMLIMAS